MHTMQFYFHGNSVETEEMVLPCMLAAILSLGSGRFQTIMDKRLSTLQKVRQPFSFPFLENFFTKDKKIYSLNKIFIVGLFMKVDFSPKVTMKRP